MLRKLGLVKYVGGMQVAAYCRRREAEGWRVPADAVSNPESAPALLEDTYFGRWDGPLNPVQIRSHPLTHAEVDMLPLTVHDRAYSFELNELETLCARSGVPYDVCRMQLDLVSEAREAHCAIKCPHQTETQLIDGVWQQTEHVRALMHQCEPRTFAELPS